MTTIVTDQIGTGGGAAYATPALWVAATTGNLVVLDRQNIGTLQNEGFTGTAAACVIAGSTTDATRNRILTSAFFPAATDAAYFDTTKGAYIDITGGASVVAVTIGENYSSASTIQIRNQSGYAAVGIQCSSVTGAKLDRLIVDVTGGSVNAIGVFSFNNTGLQTRNVLSIVGGTAANIAIFEAYGSGNTFFNCNAIRPSDITATGTGFAMRSDTVAKNCASFGFTTPYSGGDASCGWNSAVSGTSYPGSGGNNVDAAYTTATFTQPSAASAPDYRLASGSALLDVGTSGGNIPTVDLFGTSRPQGSAYDIGCVERVVAAGGSRPVKMAGSWGGFAGESGGFAG